MWNLCFNIGEMCIDRSYLICCRCLTKPSLSVKISLQWMGNGSMTLRQKAQSDEKYQKKNNETFHDDLVGKTTILHYHHTLHEKR